jgi:hypothetical protein
MMHEAIEKQYYLPRFTVGVINYGQEFIGSALRTVAESVSCATRHYYPGTPKDFLMTIASTDHEEMTLISGHGTMKGMCFCEKYSRSDIDASMLLEGGYMPAAVIAEHLKIRDTIIFGAFCHSGTDEMILAYARNGNLYIGKRAPLLSHTCFMPVFLSKFLFGLVFQKQSPEDSFEHARSIGRNVDRQELVLCRDGKIISKG